MLKTAKRAAPAHNRSSSIVSGTFEAVRLVGRGTSGGSGAWWSFLVLQAHLARSVLSAAGLYTSTHPADPAGPSSRRLTRPPSARRLSWPPTRDDSSSSWQRGLKESGETL